MFLSLSTSLVCGASREQVKYRFKFPDRGLYAVLLPCVSQHQRDSFWFSLLSLPHRVPGAQGRTSAAESSWSPPSLLQPAAKERSQRRSRSLAAQTTIWTLCSPKRKSLARSRTTTASRPRCRARLVQAPTPNPTPSSQHESRRGKRTGELWISRLKSRESIETPYSWRTRLHPDTRHLHRPRPRSSLLRGNPPCPILRLNSMKTPLTSGPWVPERQFRGPDQKSGPRERPLIFLQVSEWDQV